MKKLTIGAACWDDVEGIFWEMSILRQFHVPISNTDVQLLVIDDMPQEQKELRNMCNLLQVKYIHKPKSLGPAHAKNSVFEHAEGEYTLLLDSHVLCAPNSINYLLNAIDKNEIKDDIWSGPLVNESGHIYATELLPKWRTDFFGIWHTDEEIKLNLIEKKEIVGMGSAFFCCKTENFNKVPFPHEYKGFGGEEILSTELHRQAFGSKHYCHTTLKWQHRFYRPRPVSYRLTTNDKFENYLIGFYKCGFNCQGVVNHFKNSLPPEQLAHSINKVSKLFPDLFEKTKNGRTFEDLGKG